MSTGEHEVDSPVSTAEVEAPAKPKLAYEVQIEDVGPCKKHLKVSIPKSEVDRQFADSIGEMTKEAHVPGFRPGHAPRQLIEKRFRKEVAGQVKSTLLMTCLEQLEEDYKLNPISQPTLDIEAIVLPEDGPLRFEMDLEVRPDFVVKDYHDLTVKREIRTFHESDIDVQYKNFLERYSQIVPKLEGGAEVGDFIVANLEFKDADRLYNEAKEIQFRLQSELRFQDGKVAGIDKILTGVKPGETRVAPAQIGSSSIDPALRGRTIDAVIHVIDLKKLRLPEVNQEFFTQVGFESEEEIRAALRGVLERRLEFQRRDSIRRDILAQLIDRTPFDLPADLVARQERDVYRRQIYDLRNSGLNDSQIRAREAEIRANVHEETLKTLKEFFLLAKVAEQENIKVEDSDLEAEIRAIAERNDETVRRVRSRIEKENLADSMATQILERKAIDHILQHVKYEDVAPEEEQSVETLDQNVGNAPETTGDEAETKAETVLEHKTGTETEAAH